MPSNYNFTQNSFTYSFDDIFVFKDTFDTSAGTGLSGSFFTPGSQDIEDYFLIDSDIIDTYIGDQVWCWGRGNDGMLGINVGGPSESRKTPVPVFGNAVNWKEVSCGYRNHAAIKSDGSLWCWGRGIVGSNGDNTIINRSTPVREFSSGTTWKKVACGQNNTLAIKSDGTLFGWGFNQYAQLGDNTTNVRSTPTSVFGAGSWKEVACGELHTAAIKTDGTLWSWGNNLFGALGQNSSGFTNFATPVQVTGGGTNWKKVSCGYCFTAAIKTDGSLWSWGFNNYGQLGIGNVAERTTPVREATSGTTWKSLDCGKTNTCAIKTDGTAWCWGTNNYAQLGINVGSTPVVRRSSPVQIFGGATNWKQIAIGRRHALAIKTDGTMWTWGTHSYGATGINIDTSEVSTPIPIFSNGTNWKQVSSSYYSSSAISTGP